MWVNAHLVLASEVPWGGFKGSGYGRDLSIYALDDYSPDQRRHAQRGSLNPTSEHAPYLCAVVWAGANMGVIVSSSPAGTRSMPTIRSMIMFWKRCSGSSKR